MKHKMIRPALLLALTLAVALPTIAQSQRGFRGAGNGPQTMLSELNLTVEQEKQMQDLRFDRETVTIKLRAELQQERLLLRKLRQADDPNKKKLYAQIDKVGAIKIKMDKSRVDHMLKVRKVLTVDQFKVFSQTMRHQMGSRKGQREDMSNRHNKHFRRDRF